MAVTNTDIGLALIFCFGFFAMGVKWKELWILAGIVWIAEALTTFKFYGGDYGDLYMLVGMGMGAILMFEGAFSLWRG